MTISSKFLGTVLVGLSFFTLAKADVVLTESEQAKITAARRVVKTIDRPELARVALGGMRPLPLVPITALPKEERNRVLAFANGALKRFSTTIYSSTRDFDEAIADIALEAGATFHSPLISEQFNRLGSLSTDMRLKENEIELIDAKDRLNDLLHLWSIHLVLDIENLQRGRINLSAHLINKKHIYDVLGTSFLMYEVLPLVENEFYPALGHAEVDQGFLLLFGQTINDEVAMTSKYLEDENASFLQPNVYLGTSSIHVINALVRDEISEDIDLRARFVDTIGHHEGFHKYIEPTLAKAVSRGDLSNTDKSVWHEAGAYLYQLESSDLRFTSLDLVVILATALNEQAGFYGNKEGARQCLIRLQEELPSMRFIGESGEWIPQGLFDLFKSPSAPIKAAAGRARQRYEINARNNLR